MSELKVYRDQEDYIAYDDYLLEAYNKDEADAVIAEQKEQYFELQDTAIKIDKELTETRKQLRHQKYKRCLAMAMWCAAECVVNQNTNKAYLTHKSDFRIGHYWKWEKRWLELAEKFKEAK